MIYPKSPFCPLNDGNAKRKNYTPEMPAQYDSDDNMQPWNDDRSNYGENNTHSKCELMDIINELEFAVTDLHLFLDTHPDDKEALKTFAKLAASLKSYKHDYAQKYGPLYATDSSDETPFDWVSENHKWPWQL